MKMIHDSLGKVHSPH